jgi:hypothetical protein
MKRILRQILPQSLWDQLKKTKSWFMGKYMSRVAQFILKDLHGQDVQRTLENAGYSVARIKDYYSPLPSVPELKRNRARWDKPSALGGIKFDLESMESNFSRLLDRYGEEFASYPAYKQLLEIGFGPGYTAVDALTLYIMIRDLKPARYLEVGSGLSTYYASLAATKNAEEGFPVEMTCIEPHPYEKLYSIANISIIKDEVQSVDVSLFQTLQRNDILFIDSSHILRIDGDVPYLFLEVLPSLGVGVAIHVHDVPFPFNIPYPPTLWIFGQTWPLFWNEAMMVQAFLCGNRDFEIVLSTPLIRHFDEAFLHENVPIYQSVEVNPNAFSSIWLTRTALSTPVSAMPPRGK